MYIEKLASSLNRNDEEPNIKLAHFLADNNDKDGINEIVSGLSKKQAVANDCIKVLYEIGEQKPELISPYVSTFLTLLSVRNNRLVWGAMTALAQIAQLSAADIYRQLALVISAYENGSVITVDNSITVFAKLCNADPDYAKTVFPVLMHHLEFCRPKETAQHAERTSICINENNKAEFISVLEKRRPLLTPAQQKRIDKLIKSL